MEDLYRKQNILTFELHHEIHVSHKSGPERINDTYIHTQTHMEVNNINANTHNSHFYSFPAMKQGEVAADVKHQFPG